MAATIDAALFDTGRPVLVAPPTAPTTVGSRILIAWNGSSQASRAVAFAMPFLEKAQEVTIAVGGHEGHVPAASLAVYLERHGIRAAVENFSVTGSIGKAILDRAGRLGADMIVMGAYGHSRLREMMLGGATREVLSAATLPVLMAH